MRTPGQQSFTAYESMDRQLTQLEGRVDQCMQRGMQGESTANEFMELTRRKQLLREGMSALLTLNHKTLQRVLEDH